MKARELMHLETRGWGFSQGAMAARLSLGSAREKMEEEERKAAYQ